MKAPGLLLALVGCIAPAAYPEPVLEPVEPDAPGLPRGSRTPRAVTVASRGPRIRSSGRPGPRRRPRRVGRNGARRNRDRRK